MSMEMLRLHLLFMRNLWNRAHPGEDQCYFGAFGDEDFGMFCGVFCTSR